jgi:lipoprotein signal peptidase
VFNVADAAITFGMIALLYEALKLELYELQARRKAG